MRTMWAPLRESWGLQGCFNFLKMKEDGWLLLGSHMEAVATDLWLTSDNSSCRSGSYSCLFSRPSDSDNWQNGLKLEPENPEPRFPGEKTKLCLFGWFQAIVDQKLWLWLDNLSVQTHDGGRLLRLLLGGEARWVQRYISGDASYSNICWNGFLNLPFRRTWKQALWQPGTWRMLQGRLLSCKKTLQRFTWEWIKYSPKFSCIQIHPKNLGVHSNQQAIGVEHPDWELPTDVGRPQGVSRKVGYHSHVDSRKGDIFTKCAGEKTENLRIGCFFCS